MREKIKNRHTLDYSRFKEVNQYFHSIWSSINKSKSSIHIHHWKREMRHP